MNLVDMVVSNARKYDSREYLRYLGQTVTFSQVKELAEKTAGYLQSQDIGKGDKVAVMSLNSPAFVQAFFGTLFAGAVVVPVNHKLAPPEVDYILGHSGAKLFLFDAALSSVAEVLEFQVSKMCMDSDVSGYTRFEDAVADAPSFTPVDIRPEDLAEILYTSGTTGKPKGCRHSHRNVIQAGITMALAIKIDAGDRILMGMPIWHSSPLNNWFVGASYVGAVTVLIREYHPLHFLQAIQDEKCTAYFGAPISFIMPIQMIPNFDSFDLSSMRVWMYGGGPIGADTARMLADKYKSDQFYQCYGMSEAGPTGTILFPDEQVSKAGSIGRVGLPGCDIVVMNNDGTPTPAGGVGEIWLKAASMMDGYLNDEDATAKAFENGWYKTGDMARVDEDRFMFIVDRAKDMIITGGENVYSKEVEDVLFAHPDVSQAAVIGTPHPEWGETVTAIVVPEKDKAPDEESIKSFLKDKLAKYKIPRQFHIVDALPHTASGKVMKYQLRDSYFGDK